MTLAMLISGRKPKKFLNAWYFEVGEGWGGLEFGPCFLTEKDPTRPLLEHEYGHGVQNCFIGPVMILLVCIPSAIRYSLRKLESKHGRKLKPYDAVWFEAWASRLGREANRASKKHKRLVTYCKECQWVHDEGPGGLYCTHPDSRNPLGCREKDFCNDGEPKWTRK